LGRCRPPQAAPKPQLENDQLPNRWREGERESGREIERAREGWEGGREREEGKRAREREERERAR